MCSAIKFLPDASIHVILSPILQKLAGHPSQKTVNKVQRLLHRAVVGLAHNTTVTVPKLLVYVHELVSNYAFLDIRREKKNASTDGHRRHRGTDVWLAGEGGLDEHALTKPGQGDSNQKLRIRKRRGLLAHDKEKTFLVAPEPSFNGGTSMSDRLDDERSNRGSVGNTSGCVHLSNILCRYHCTIERHRNIGILSYRYAFSVTAENDDDEYGDYESDEEAAAARVRWLCRSKMISSRSQVTMGFKCPLGCVVTSPRLSVSAGTQTIRHKWICSCRLWSFVVAELSEAEAAVTI